MNSFVLSNRRSEDVLKSVSANTVFKFLLKSGIHDVPFSVQDVVFWLNSGGFHVSSSAITEHLRRMRKVGLLKRCSPIGYYVDVRTKPMKIDWLGVRMNAYMCLREYAVSNSMNKFESFISLFKSEKSELLFKNFYRIVILKEYGYPASKKIRKRNFSFTTFYEDVALLLEVMKDLSVLIASNSPPERLYLRESKNPYISTVVELARAYGNLTKPKNYPKRHVLYHFLSSLKNDGVNVRGDVHA